MRPSTHPPHATVLGTGGVDTSTTARQEMEKDTETEKDNGTGGGGDITSSLFSVPKKKLKADDAAATATSTTELRSETATAVRKETEVLEGSTGTAKAGSLPTLPLPPPRAVMFSESSRNNTDEDRRSSRNNRPTPPMTVVGRKSKRIQRLLSQVQLPRLITRDYPYHQSSSRVEITNVQRHILYRLIYRDWFHLLLRQPAWVTFPSIILVWYTAIWVWAYAYVLVDRHNGSYKDCGISEAEYPIDIREAFAFSLETTTTVGCKYHVEFTVHLRNHVR